MRLSFLFAGCIILAAILCAGCTSQTGETPAAVTSPTASASVTAIPVTTPAHVDFSIQASPGRYSPFMSSTVGIRLTPDYTASVPVIYNWTADYGYFVSWNAPDYRVVIHNRSIETADPYIYWSYPPDDMGKEKPPVKIRLIIESERLIHGGGGGRGTIAWKDIHIRWEDTDTAVAES